MMKWLTGKVDWTTTPKDVLNQWMYSPSPCGEHIMEHVKERSALVRRMTTMSLRRIGYIDSPQMVKVNRAKSK